MTNLINYLNLAVSNAMDLTKRVAYRNKKILAAAKDERCCICGENDGTTVFCHFDELWAGKAMSQKADDCAGFFGCYECHRQYSGLDNAAPPSYSEVLRAYYRTIRRLLDLGVLK